MRSGLMMFLGLIRSSSCLFRQSPAASRRRPGLPTWALAIPGGSGWQGAWQGPAHPRIKPWRKGAGELLGWWLTTRGRKMRVGQQSGWGRSARASLKAYLPSPFRSPLGPGYLARERSAQAALFQRIRQDHPSESSPNSRHMWVKEVRTTLSVATSKSWIMPLVSRIRRLPIAVRPFDSSCSQSHT